MKQIKAKIIENKKIAQGFYKMRVGSSYLAKNTKPGQFFEVKCSDGDETLLRRPLGAHRILKNGVEMLYEVVGKGTELLSKKKAGGLLDIIGPLGNGFILKPKTQNLKPSLPLPLALSLELSRLGVALRRSLVALSLSPFSRLASAISDQRSALSCKLSATRCPPLASALLPFCAFALPRF